MSLAAGPLLVVWTEFPPRTGGIQVHGAEFCRHLAGSGIPFRVLTWAPTAETERRECAAFDAQADFRIDRVLPRGDFPAALAECARAEACLAPVAVYSSQIALAPAFRSPVVCRTAGNDFLRPWVGPAEVSPEGLEINRAHCRQAASRCAAIVCNSRWTAARLEEFAPGTVAHVLSGGVDTERFFPVPKAEARRVLGWNAEVPVVMAAARHVLKKGLDLAILASRDWPDARLVLLGTGPETAALMRMARESGVEHRTDFPGMIPHHAMPLYLNAADIVVFPSREAFDPGRHAVDYETMGRLPCEAMACGTYVVAADTGGVGEIVEDGVTGTLVPPGGVEALAGAVRAVLLNGRLRRERTEAARQRAVSQFSFDRINSATLRILDAAVRQ